jgi:predicted dehydrogenase
MTNLKIALLGCGRIARIAHLHALRRIRGASLVALADADAGRLQEAARLAPDAALFPDYRELLRDCDAEAVVITLPSHLHADAATTAFESGRHVYLEKPIAVDELEARAILDAERTSGRIGMIGFNFRFHPAYREMQRGLRSGRIGRVVAVRSVFCSAPRHLPEWKLARATGGSALLDLASHHIDLVHYLLAQPVVEVRASVRSIRSEADTASLELSLADGVLVQHFVSMRAAEQDRFDVIGEDGVLSFDRYRPGATLELYPAKRASGRKDRLLSAVGLATGIPRQLIATLRSPMEPTYELALRAFVHAIAAGGTSPVALEEGRRSLTVVLASEESARLARALQLPVPKTASSSSVRDPRVIEPGSPADSQIGADLNRIAVVVVTPDSFGTIRRTVRHLRAQTVRDRIELILVGPTGEDLRDRDASDIDGFASVLDIAVGSIDNVDKAAAHGVFASRAGVVALVEDHAYPEPEWAEALLDAHKGPWAAVGSVVLNANPESSLSWTNLLLAYGSWVEPVERGETRSVSRHNISFKRSALAAYGRDLIEMMGRDGGLLQRMLARGDRFYLEPRARIRHANPSRLSATLTLRLNGGRLSGATRARVERWSIAKRMAYVAGAPLFPFLRARLLRRKISAAGLFPRAFPSIVMGLALDGIGQAIGFLLGAGDTARKLADFEVDRLRHVTAADRRLLEK